MIQALRVAFCVLVIAAPAAADSTDLTIETTTEVSVVPLGRGHYVDTNKTWHVFIGDTTRTEIERTEFYRLVDREDLATRYERRRTIAMVAIATGLSAVALGGFLMLGDKQDSYTTAGGFTVVGGVVALGVGAYCGWTANTVSEDEARYLADVHNATNRERNRRLRLSAFPGGAGVTAGGSF